MRTRRVAFPLQRPDRPQAYPQRHRLFLAGFLAAFRGEAAFRQLVLLNVVLIPVAFLLDVSRGERALMIAVCLLALIVELLNSAIEATVDRVSLERHPLSKNAKDMGSAAQFVALTVITVTWATILLG